MLLQNYKIKNTDKAFLNKNLKNFDASCSPTFYTELLNKWEEHTTLRTWNNATVSDPIVFEPGTSRWTLTL